MPRLRCALSALLVVVPLFATGSAGAATLSISPPTSATEEASAAIGISGTTETARTLFASVVPESRSCAASAIAQESSGVITRLTGAAGAVLASGPFSQSFTYTPADDGRSRVCAYLVDIPGSATAITAEATFTVSPPASTLRATLNVSQFEPGDSIQGSVSATSPVGGRELQYGWSGPSGDCSTFTGSPATVSLSPGAAVDRVTTLPAAISTPSYRFCAAVVEIAGSQREATSEALATALPRDALLAKWRPTLLTEDGEEQEDRLRLRWQTKATSAEDETLEIWDEDPSDGADPVFTDLVGSEDLELMDSPVDQQDARVRKFLGFREFWWSVGTAASNGEIAWSEVRTVTVVPSPMNKKRVKVSTKFKRGYSTKRPGWIRLRIQSSPRARVTAQVFYRGRLFKRMKYTEGVGKLRGFDFALSCSRQGVFSYVVRMRDPYGTKAVKKGSWTTSPSRCASLRAKEQRKAAEEERKRREREERNRGGSGGGGGGSSDCDPNYEGYCLDPNASDYDCAGGSGDGPKYVPVTVTVVGTDHYGLDADNDGLGCE